MERLELHLTYTCPEACTFCSEAHRMERFRLFPVTFARAATVLRLHRARGIRAVHFTGGEPTIHPRFVDLLRLAKKLGMRTSVGTIGTMLSREDFAQAAVPWLDEALFSLHGPDAATHDTVAGRAGSWEQVQRALTNCVRLRPGFGAMVNTVLCRPNLEALPETAALASRLGARLLVISNTTPEGGALDRYETLAPSLADLRRVLPLVPQRAAPAVVRFFGVPLCLLGEHTMLSNDLHWDPRVTVEWVAEPGAVRFADLPSWGPGRKRVHVEACQGCGCRALCPGVFDRYAELWPTDELRPRAAP
jgi:MoaA/NifB/PqqE/SkfB family radical SAM enzyme